MASVERKELNFEINLLPVISVLAVTICALLISAVWIVIGSMGLKQATGALGILSDRTPLLVISLSGGQVEVQLKNTLSNHLVAWSSKDPATQDRLVEDIQSLKQTVPGLDAAIVLSAKETSYQRIIATLEILKAKGFSQVGVSPL
ncbi:MAG: hypothetical protein C5B49_04965 [Bdellovibrio sp.]|nr:MAG: hypothetical protein C5B49_04965 [Bdellovibrio sp.]